MSNSCLRAFDDGSRIGMANQQAALHGLDDVNLTRSALVYHVQNALGSVPYGDSDCYNQLVGVMHHTRRLAPDEVALLELVMIYVENMLKLESSMLGEIIGSVILEAVVERLRDLDGGMTFPKKTTAKAYLRWI